MMLTAAVTGVIDFSEARLGDPRWARRRDWLLLGLVQQNEQKRRKAELIYYAAILIAISKSGGSGLSKTAETLYEALTELDYSLEPWRRSEEQLKEKRLARSSFEAWQQAYGRMDDPEVREKLRRLDEYFRSNIENPPDTLDPLGRKPHAVHWTGRQLRPGFRRRQR